MNEEARHAWAQKRVAEVHTLRTIIAGKGRSLRKRLLRAANLRKP